MSTATGSQIGMALPETADNRTRWADAAPKMAMALSEAGYPTRYEPFWTPGREHELVFGATFPPRDVMLRAGEVCGARPRGVGDRRLQRARLATPSRGTRAGRKG